MKSVFLVCVLVLATAPLLLAQAAPTPEPSSFVLLGTGIAGLGFVIWKRSRRKKLDHKSAPRR